MYHESEKVGSLREQRFGRDHTGRKWGGLFELFPNGSDSVTVDLSVGGGAVLYPHLDVQIDRSYPYQRRRAVARLHTIETKYRREAVVVSERSKTMCIHLYRC
jgi:hypothetical protein